MMFLDGLDAAAVFLEAALNDPGISRLFPF
jgi:hypothetical protein